jgi:hypothetical protein
MLPVTSSVTSCLRSTAVPGPRARLGVLAVLLTMSVAVTGCSSSGNGSSSADHSSSPTTTPSSTPTASTSASASSRASGGTHRTAPGTMLAFGDTATVPYQAEGKSTVLGLTVKSAAKGTLADFRGFDMSDPYKRKASYYYVRVSVRNAGKKRFGGVPVPLWGISDNGTLLQAVDFRSAFGKCPTQALPKGFEPRQKLDTCLVYLSPNHGGLKGVSYRPTVDFQPVEWHGKVRQPKSKTKSGKSGKGTKG